MALISDYRQCGFDDADDALCEYAIELTLWPGDSSQAKNNKLREQRFTDEQITVPTQLISYFNYINRIADGLGVDPEDWMTVPLEQWLAEKPIWRDIL